MHQHRVFFLFLALRFANEIDFIINFILKILTCSNGMVCKWFLIKTFYVFNELHFRGEYHRNSSSTRQGASHNQLLIFFRFCIGARATCTFELNQIWIVTLDWTGHWSVMKWNWWRLFSILTHSIELIPKSVEDKYTTMTCHEIQSKKKSECVTEAKRGKHFGKHKAWIELDTFEPLNHTLIVWSSE